MQTPFSGGPRRPGLRKFSRVPLAALLLVASLLLAPLAPARAQPFPAAGRGPALQQDQAVALLAQMTPEEKVGQLFLLSYQGTDVSPTSQIYQLITEHHISGVVIRARNDNLIGAPNQPEEAPRQLYESARALQLGEWNASLKAQISPTSGDSFLPTYIPLFIGLAQEGDGYPNDQVLTGMTRLSNQMALGASWIPDLAARSGEVLGKELSILGVNLLLGPSLDVLDTPNLGSTTNLGTRTFGGDPYWVGQMGSAYIRGVHTGGGGRIVVAATHFPGHGSSDRLPEEEVATVRKPLEELTNFDLAPFFAVTGNAASPLETADALLTSHIRYQGLQGNIRATTRPVSFDPQALDLLLKLPPLNTWLQNGGVMISDDLSNLAVRRFYDLTSQTFDPRRVALNAFLAGNDLLYVADFSSNSTPDAFTGVVRTLEFFAQKYREDAAFAQQVDDSVLRLINLKLRMYNTFTYSNVLASAGRLSELGQNQQVTFDVARQSATLLSPTQEEIDSTIPDPPNQNDRVVFVTDTRSGQQCSTCPAYPLIPPQALQEAVLRLYGPQAGGQVNTNNLISFTMEDLQAMLANRPAGEGLERSLERASWIVMSITGDVGAQPLKQFLNERPDLFLQKRLIVFAFSAPYYLDATDISKLTAYYALYSKTPEFIDTAAYLLFQELRPVGAPPVSVAGIAYNLNEALFPNPAVPIPLEIELAAPAPVITSTATPEPTPVPQVRLGDVLPLRAGVILDHNGHAVPDGTPVHFIFALGGSEANSVRQTEITKGGVARTAYTVTAPGALEIHVESENARSRVIRVDIPPPGGEIVTITPTEAPTATSTPTPPLPTATQALIAATPPPAPVEHSPGFGDWLIAVLVSGGIGLAAYRLAAAANQKRWGLRAGTLALIGGLSAYTYIAAALPGSAMLLQESTGQAVLTSSLVGAVLGLLAALAWRLSVRLRSSTPASGKISSGRVAAPPPAEQEDERSRTP